MKNYFAYFLLPAFLGFFLSGQISPAIGQSPSINLEGIGIEVGAGYNQLFWKANTIFGEEHYDRTAFSIMPSIRVHYQRTIGSYVAIYSFFGYNEFGGASELDESKTFTAPDILYEDRIKIRSLESGIMGQYPIKNLHMGLGLKGSYHLDFENKFYYENRPNYENGWHTDDNSLFFKRWSMDAGIRMAYHTKSHLIFGAEGWFGITDLGDDDFQLFIRENHFRILVGYQL